MAGQVLLCVENEHKAREYTDALLLAGLPVSQLTVLTPPAADGDLGRLAATAAGLVLAGGPDIHPRHFGEEPLEGAGLRINEELDRLELELLAGAREGRTPVWAICKGMQTANVFLGGDLFQDLGLQFPGVGNHIFKEPLDHPAHHLEGIASKGPFGDALARHDAPVNSRHHQAVRKLAPGLRAVAHAPDGVLECFEWADDDWWLKGVQWHPENLTSMPCQLELWRQFVAACQELDR